MFGRVLRWLRTPVMPPRWFRDDHDPLDDVDWGKVGRAIGGRLSAISEHPPSPAVERRWREGGRRPPPAPWPRWQWLFLAAVVVAEIAGLIALFVFLDGRAH